MVALIVRGEIPNGSGYGDGDGSGSGDGSGDGDGSGYGSGYGDGSGDGDGSGYGYGSGYGDGSGSGDGDGSGYGSGSKEYWLGCIGYFSEKWTELQRERLARVRDLGLPLAYWRSDARGCACNGGRNDPVSPGTIETTAGPLDLCSQGTLHATLLPPRWKGERWWIVALHGEVVGDEEKYGCLKREVIGEAL